MVIRNQTILLDTFIELLDDEFSKLNKKQVREILIDDIGDNIGDNIPESEDKIVENYKEPETRSIYLKFIMVRYM